jgi:hypothetical protein
MQVNQFYFGRVTVLYLVSAIWSFVTAYHLVIKQTKTSQILSDILAPREGDIVYDTDPIYEIQCCFNGCRMLDKKYS